MLGISLVFWKSEPQYVYKRYAYKEKNMYSNWNGVDFCVFMIPTATWYYFITHLFNHLSWLCGIKYTKVLNKFARVMRLQFV